MLRFQRPVNLRNSLGTLMYPLHGSNVFDQRGLACNRVDFVEPRSVRLTTTLTF